MLENEAHNNNKRRRRIEFKGATKVHLAEFNKKKKKTFVSRAVDNGKILKMRIKDLFKTFLFSSTSAYIYPAEFD